MVSNASVIAKSPSSLTPTMTCAGPHHALHESMCVVNEVGLGFLSYVKALDLLSQHFSQKSDEVVARCLKRAFALG